MVDSIEELRAKIAESQKQIQQLEDEKREEQSAAWDEITKNPSNWEWHIEPKIRKEFFTTEIMNGAQISKRIKPEVVKEWESKGPSTFSSDFQRINQWHGMFYYRTDENIITEDGGGHVLLKTPKLCSDEEWAAILAGNIPAKFLK